MEVVLLAGGMGTRIMEESELRPKPMAEIGGMPILWHIMKEYSHYGFNDFIICAGYRQYMIKEWFSDYFFHTSDVTFDFTQGNRVTIHDQRSEPWKVTVVDTGYETMTGGRLRRVRKYITGDTFMMTYGDGVCDVDIAALLKFHQSHGRLATLTSVRQKQEKGVLDIALNNSVRSFREKNKSDAAPINAGYMVLSTKLLDRWTHDETVFERDVLMKLADEGELMSYQHDGFWQCMDNIYEKKLLESMIANNDAPWIKWSEDGKHG